ncbi:ABC transporter ATP-binding protein [Candidatus Nomurabacteria bacterium]|nr:ABC transporter ATP-binding protein [Candidatus Nomurabacteria bacterium]
MDALKISHFSKKYGDFTAVNDISLTIPKGEFFGFLGPNGAGKSSTIHAITGINTITSGSIEVFGIDVEKEYKHARTKVGLSPQEFNIDIFLPVDKILWFNGGLFGLDKEKRKQQLEKMMEIFELEKHRKKQFRQLSGGLKRRVMLARAMMHDPELLILDEPTAGVDVELRHELWEYLKKINQEGKTILLTSHYLEEVQLLCNHIAVINDGKIVLEGSKKELTKDGKTLEQVYLEVTKK